MAQVPYGEIGTYRTLSTNALILLSFNSPLRKRKRREWLETC